MGNRFRDLTQYHLLIRGHGVVAALNFLLIVPSAIMIARFYVRSPRWALRLHIWLQILTVALTTVVFVLGWFAVGPERSLTNPHHGIGLAIYVLVLTQAIGGWWVHGREKGKRRMFNPLKLMVGLQAARSDPVLLMMNLLTISQFHQWLGRMIALLGLAQIPLGLTLYGSPAVLFVLYALAAFALFVAYFVLTYARGRRMGYDYDSQRSYGTGSETNNGQRQHRGLRDIAKATAAGAGLTALLRGRSRSPSRNRNRAEVVGSRRPSGSYIAEEKYSQYGRDPGREGGGWTDRLLKIGAVAGAATLAKNMFDRRKDRQRDSDVRRHNMPHGGAQSISEDSLARLEEGRPLPSRQHPLNQPLNPPLNPPLNHRRSHSSLSYDSYLSDEGAGARGHRFRDGIATLGAAGLLRNVFKNRRERKEQRRVEELRRRELEEERIARANSQGRYTGDGFPTRAGRRGSLTTSTDFTGSINNRPRPNHGVPPPVPAGVLPAGVAGAALSNGNRRGNTTLGANNPVITGAVNHAVNMPPIPPDPQGLLHQDTSGSEAYISAGGRPHRRHHSGRDGLAPSTAAGTGAGLAASEANRHHSTGDDSVASPPVSVKVKMHRDGRHVTLRRLPEEEAAAEREVRRRERQGKHHRRRSASSLGGTDGTDRWRRTEALERQQAEEMKGQNETGAEQRAEGLYPPPPPIPSSVLSPGTGSVGSPGTYDGTGTEGSADYANNRRRRRAERAQARQARQGNQVEFE